LEFPESAKTPTSLRVAADATGIFAVR